MTDPWPAHDSGLLDVGDGQRIHWETGGVADGPPALWLHGGPGSGCSPGPRRALGEAGYRAVLVDQRQCGRSLPHAADPAVDLTVNTTAHLVADLEAVREHLGIERWLLRGGSWGSTLALAYALRHPGRVTRMVLGPVTTSSPGELHWLYAGAGRFVPEAWERFRGFLPAPYDDHGVRHRDGDVRPLLAAYGRACADPEPAVRDGAARAWAAWEDALIADEAQGTPGAYSDRAPGDLLAMVRICAHYFAHDAFLADTVPPDTTPDDAARGAVGSGVLLDAASRLAGIPATLVHGRWDLSGPVDTAWELARRWPGAELVVVEDAGHTGSAAFRDALHAALVGAA